MQTQLLFPGAGGAFVVEMEPAPAGTVVSMSRVSALRHHLTRPYADKKFVVEVSERQLDSQLGQPFTEAFQILTLREWTP
jgi:hypothetical protein